MLSRFADSEHGVFPILDKEGKLTGLVETRELQIVAGQPEVGPLIVASEIAHTPITVTLDESLLSAARATRSSSSSTRKMRTRSSAP